MLRIGSQQRETEAAQCPADDLDLLVYEPHYGLRYVLEQIFWFHVGCAELDLPISDPFSFFEKLNDELREDNRKNFQIDGKKEDPLAFRPQYIGLLLLYACYGDLLFCTGHPAKQKSWKLIISLRDTSSERLQEYLQWSQMHEPLREMVELVQQNKVYDLFPELQHLEELNEQWNRLSLAFTPTDGLADPKRQQTQGITITNLEKYFENRSIIHEKELPEAFATRLYDIFLDFYKKQNRIIDENKEQNRTTVKNQRMRLKSAFELRALAADFAAQTEGKALDAAVLQEYTNRLVDWMKAETTWLSPALPKFSQASQVFASGERDTSERMKTENAQLIGLARLQQDTVSFNCKQIESMQNRIQVLMKSYQNDSLYGFFDRIYDSLRKSPFLQGLAPAYVWQLFVRHQGPLYKGQDKLHGEQKQPDFSVRALVNDWKAELRSEERTSIAHAMHDLDLYNQLEAYFDQQPIGPVIDKPMCEHLIQRMLLTQMSIESDTSIFGTQLKHPKPLFRGFALIHRALEQMGQNLWTQMPCEGKHAVTLEEADAFFQEKLPGCKQHKVMSYLLERAGNPPDSRKKHLTIQDCSKVAKWLAQSCAGMERSDQAKQALLTWLDKYIHKQEELRDYAAQSRKNREMVMYAICRLAAKRTAHDLTRKTLQTCAELFYLWIPISDLQKMWKILFSQRKEILKHKSVWDRISIGNLTFQNRLWKRIPISCFKEVTMQDNLGAAVLTGTLEQVIQICSAQRESCSWPVFYEYPEELSVEHRSFSKAQEAAQQLSQFGCAGIIFSIRLHTIRLKSNEEQEENKCILDYWARYKAIMGFLKEERSALPKDFKLLIQFCLQDTTSATHDSVRTCMRWCLDGGVNAALLTPSFPLDRAGLILLQQIVESQPGSVLLSLSDTQYDLVDSLLRSAEIDAVVIDKA